MTAGEGSWPSPYRERGDFSLRFEMTEEDERRTPQNLALGLKTNLDLDSSINNDIILDMEQIRDLLKQIQKNPANVRFSELCKICEHYFGEPRQSGGSHRIFKTPWQGDPRVNIQNSKGKAKAYQVRQVLKAIERFEDENAAKK